MSLLAAACGGSDSGAAGGDQIQIVATTTLIGEVVSNVAGSDASVTVLTPNGADPHDFQPSSAQVAQINEADLVVSNGLGLEEGFLDILDAAQGDGVNILELAPALNPLPFMGEPGNHDEDDEEDHEAEDEDGHEHDGGLDPHFWFDPLRLADASDLIAQELGILDASIDWQTRSDDYRQLLEGLDAELQTLFESVPASKRTLVTNHDSLGYLADRYDFEVVGTVLPSGSDLGNPSSGELASLVALIADRGVTAIFADTTLSTELAEAVAAELGSAVQVVEIYTGSLGEPGSGAETLPAMLRTNAERIAAALSG